MKSKIKFPARPLLAPLLAFAAIGLQMPSCVAAAAADNHDSRSRADRDRMGAPLKASELIGQKIENNEGQKVGSVEDLAIDLQAGRVVQLIVSTGGFLSMGERHSAVPPGSVHFRAKGKPLHFDITREKLKAAPAFEMSAWKDYYQSDRVQEAYRYYGEEPAFEARTTRGNGPENVTSATRATGLGHVQRATKLMGLKVQNLQEEKIGDVDNLIIDLPAGRVVAVIVSSGGFLGMGDTLSVVPPTALRFNADHDGLRLDTTKEALRDAPRFKAGEWPDFSQRDYTAGVYRAYKQEPYMGRDAGNAARSSRDTDNAARNTRDTDYATRARDVDNTRARDTDNNTTRGRDADNAARNTRDRDGRTLTPADQGGNVSDVTLTQQIRKAVTDTEGLSVNARNVKIITVNGRVTLRGPVRNADEKAKIAAIAARFAQAGNVDDQLEVAAR